jgi:septum formation protein
VSRLVLASTSPYRRVLLERLGVSFDVDDPGVDEITSGVVRDRVTENAFLKARASRQRHPAAVVIGSDQLAELDGKALGKPGTADAARRQLAELAGREHRLLTAVTVLGGDERRDHLDVTRLHLRDLSEEEIADYVERENPVDCAGAYKIEGLGIALFDYVQGEDPSAIVGLPLMALTQMLRAFGIRVLGR